LALEWELRCYNQRIGSLSGAFLFRLEATEERNR
jgi:hypothetical protein